MNTLIAFLMLTHGWYPQACCGDHDCRPVPCEEISEDNTGYYWNKLFFAKDKIHASHDNNCHVCIHIDIPGMGPSSLPVCMFVLQNS